MYIYKYITYIFVCMYTYILCLFYICTNPSLSIFSIIYFSFKDVYIVRENANDNQQNHGCERKTLISCLLYVP